MATKGDISTLDELKFGGEYFIPLLSSFSGSRNSGLIQTSAQGGASRQRKKYYGTTYSYEAKFFLDNQAMQDYFKIFFERNEGKKFICHVAADRPIVEPYVVQVTSDWQDDYRSMVDGLLSVTLEVFSVRYPALDETLFELYTSEGDNTTKVITLFNGFVEKMP